MESRDCEARESKCKITTTVTVEKPCKSVTLPLKVVTSVTIDQMDPELEVRPALVDHKPPVDTYFDNSHPNHPPKPVPEYPTDSSDINSHDNRPEPVPVYPDNSNMNYDGHFGNHPIFCTHQSNNDSHSLDEGIKNMELEPFDQFSADLFKFASKKYNNNLVISPLSAHSALMLAGTGAREDTAKEIWSALKLSETWLLMYMEMSKKYTDRLNNTENMTIKLLRKLFISKQFEVKEDFKIKTQEYFKATEELLDFHDSNNSADAINSWVSKETNDRIKHLVASSDIREDTKMIIANVLYFKGQWLSGFDKNLTSITPFKTMEKSYSVQMMNQSGSFKYGVLPEIKAKFIELPYENPNCVMMLLLPDEIGGLEQLEENLETMSIRSITERGSMKNVKILLPRFKIESTIAMKDILKEMGMISMFSESADFSGISDTLNGVNDVVQKAFIEVDEAGTEAAATTIIDIRTKTLIFDEETLVFNHPFHFKIFKEFEPNQYCLLFSGNCKSF